MLLTHAHFCFLKCSMLLIFVLDMLTFGLFYCNCFSSHHPQSSNSYKMLAKMQKTPFLHQNTVTIYANYITMALLLYVNVQQVPWYVSMQRFSLVVTSDMLFSREVVKGWGLLCFLQTVWDAYVMHRVLHLINSISSPHFVMVLHRCDKNSNTFHGFSHLWN